MQIHDIDTEGAHSASDPNTLTTKVAEYAGMTSGYLKVRRVSGMFDDASRLIRRFPEHSLLAAAAAGVLLGYAFRRR